MKKEDFVKIGIPEELAAKCEAASLEELKGYVPRGRMNEVSEENKSLKQTAADRDKQLEKLKSLGEDNAELKKQLDALQQQYDRQQKSHSAELEQIRLDSAVGAALTASGARNIKAVLPFVNIAEVSLGEDGRLTGLEEQIEKIRETDGYLFNDRRERQSFKGFLPEAAGDDMPAASADFSGMTYSELAAYMAANPDVTI